jgi:hypothetical protein
MGAQAGAPGTMSLATPGPAEPPAPEAKIKVFSFVPRVGLQLGGGGTFKQGCDGNACTLAGVDTVSTDYSLETAFAIGADFLFKVHDLVRIGPGIFHTFTTKATPSGQASQETGSFTELNFVGEVTPRVSPIVWLIPRLQVGMAMFNASGPFGDLLTAQKNQCSTDAADASAAGGSITGCDSFGNPHVGYDIGAGFGAMFAVGPTIRLRTDFLYEYYSVGVGEESASAGSDSLTLNWRLSGSRYFLLAGMEI